MMRGRIVAGEMIIPLELMSQQGIRRIEAVIDTGFTDVLTLPLRDVQQLGLTPVASVSAILANGSVVILDVYEGVMLWDGERRTVRIHCTEGGALVGMSLLSGYRLIADIVEGGSVSIERLQNPGAPQGEHLTQS
jgi:clan AA aspartic protease